MTFYHGAAAWVKIIPYQELLGNYDGAALVDPMLCIIPYQELLGNYDAGGVL